MTIHIHMRRLRLCP